MRVVNGKDTHWSLGQVCNLNFSLFSVFNSPCIKDTIQINFQKYSITKEFEVFLQFWFSNEWIWDFMLTLNVFTLVFISSLSHRSSNEKNNLLQNRQPSFYLTEMVKPPLQTYMMQECNWLKPQNSRTELIHRVRESFLFQIFSLLVMNFRFFGLIVWTIHENYQESGILELVIENSSLKSLYP